MRQGCPELSLVALAASGSARLATAGDLQCSCPTLDPQLGLPARTSRRWACPDHAHGTLPPHRTQGAADAEVGRSWAPSACVVPCTGL